jgi:hypothetical protein
MANQARPIELAVSDRVELERLQRWSGSPAEGSLTSVAVR